MHDIKDKDDIKRLIDHFYEQVKADTLIGPIFNEAAHIDWATHLPVMYNFWAFLLLNERDYTGNPIQKHIELHAIHRLNNLHFDRWLELFQGSVDALFSGPIADTAKFRAFAIASTWKPKFDQISS